jgi:hypothetical protein
MTKSSIMVRPFPLFIFCNLLVIAVLTACGTANGNTGTPSTNTVTPTVSNLTNSFQGAGFSIHYPNQWTKDSASAGDSVYFRDSSSSYHWLAVRVEGVGSNPEDTDELSTAYNDVLYELGHGSQCQKDTGLANTTSINGINWTQVEEVCAVVGTSTSPPALTIHVLVTTHSQKYFIIDEVAPPDVFEHLSRTIFQPMLQSITFR